MTQVYVIKKITYPDGKTESRNMTLPENIWKALVKGEGKEKNVDWELRKSAVGQHREVKLSAK